MEPHIHGSTAKGDEVLLCYQLEGGSASRDHSPWRLFHVDRIHDLEILDSTFGARDEAAESREVPIVHCIRNPARDD